MSDETLVGRAEVRIENIGDKGERHIYLALSGLPGWLLGMVRDAGPLTIAASTYAGGSPGPTTVQFHAERVFVVAPVTTEPER